MTNKSDKKTGAESTRYSVSANRNKISFKGPLSDLWTAVAFNPTISTSWDMLKDHFWENVGLADNKIREHLADRISNQKYTTASEKIARYQMRHPDISSARAEYMRQEHNERLMRTIHKKTAIELFKAVRAECDSFFTDDALNDIITKLWEDDQWIIKR